MTAVTLGIQYFPDKDKGKPVFNGFVFVGLDDLDPTILANQKQITLRLEDGSSIQVGQPLRTGTGGVVLYQGSAVQIQVDGSHSILVQNSSGKQVYYVPTNANYIDASDIDYTLTASVGQRLDNLSFNDYAELRLLTAGEVEEFEDGDEISITDTGLAGSGNLRKVAGHGLADDGGTIIVINSNTFWIRNFIGPRSVLWYGAKADGVTDDIIAIQAAITPGGSIIFPAGAYVISAPIELRETALIVGVADPDLVIRVQARILPNGNFATFTSDEGGTTGQQYIVRGFEIEYGNTVPTDAPTEDKKIAFNFVPKDANPWTAPYSRIEDIEVNGAWRVYYDNSDNYKNRHTGIVGRFCKFGFFKRLGTMMQFDSCSASLGENNFHLEDTVSPTLINCSGDSNSPIPGSTPGDAVNFFFSCSNVSILGWDVEGNNLVGDQLSYFHFRDTQASITGLAGFSNSMSCAAGEFITWVRASSNADLLVNVPNLKSITPATDLSFVGTGGDCSAYRADGGGIITIVGGDATAPTGGTPDNRFSVQGVGGDFFLFAAEVDELTANVRFANYGANTDLQRLRFPGCAGEGTGAVTKDFIDCYEEGTFTASLQAGGVEWTTITASFVRTGNEVTIRVSDENSTYAAGPAGLFTIEDLPFTAGAGESSKAVGSFVFRENGTGVTRTVLPIIENGDTKISFFEIANAASTTSNVNAPQIFQFNGASGNYFTVNISYLID